MSRFLSESTSPCWQVLGKLKKVEKAWPGPGPVIPITAGADQARRASPRLVQTTPEGLRVQFLKTRKPVNTS